MLHAIVNRFRNAHTRTRILPLAFFAILLFSLPVVYGTHITPAIAQAGFFDLDIGAMINKVLLYIPTLIHGLTATLLIWSGKLFSWAIETSTSGETYSNLKFITTAWTFIRDLLNSLFIFIVLYMAFTSALTTGGFPAIDKKRLSNLVVAALLINFSLFFVKVAVDTSNVISRGIYYRIVVDTPSGPTYGPINAIAEGLMLQTEIKGSTGSNGDLGPQLLVILGGILINLVVFAIFVSIAFMFISRIIVIIGVMIVSPAWFAGMIFPGMKKETGKIWNELKGQLIWPPVFLLVCFVVVKFIEAMNQAGLGNPGGKGFADAMAGDTGAFAILINYGIIIGFLTYGAKAAKGLGQAKFSGMVNAKTSALGGAVLAGGGAIAYRNAAGGTARFGRWAAEASGAEKYIKTKAETSRLARTTLRLGKTTTKVLEEGTGDIRNAGKLLGKTPLAGGLITGALGATGTKASDFGKATTKTFKTYGAGVTGASSEDIEKKAKTLMDLGPAAMVDMIERGTFLNKANQSLLLGERGGPARKAVVDHIKDKLKDDPVKQKELLDRIFTQDGQNLLSTDKNIKKEFGKDYEDISKKVKSGGAKRAIDADEKDEKRYQELYTKSGRNEKEQREMEALAKGGKNVSAAGARVEMGDLKTKIANNAATDADKRRHDELAARLDGLNKQFGDMSTEDFMKLSTARMTALSGNITKNQIEALSKALEEGTYKGKDADIANLEKLAQDIRVNNASSDAAKALTMMAIKGTGGFGGINIKLVDALKTTTDPAAIEKVVKAMQPDELRDAVFDVNSRGKITSEMLASMPPNAFREVIKKQNEVADAEVEKFLAERQTEINTKLKQLDVIKGMSVSAAANDADRNLASRISDRDMRGYKNASNILGGQAQNQGKKKKGGAGGNP